MKTIKKQKRILIFFLLYLESLDFDFETSKYLESIGNRKRINGWNDRALESNELANCGVDHIGRDYDFDVGIDLAGVGSIALTNANHDGVLGDMSAFERLDATRQIGAVKRLIDRLNRRQAAVRFQEFMLNRLIESYTSNNLNVLTLLGMNYHRTYEI